MLDIPIWPAGVLKPQSSPFNPRPFSRGGGRTLGGISRSIRSDRGYWVGSYQNIIFRRTNYDQARTWNALRTALCGSTGLIIVPVCSTALWAGYGIKRFGVTVPHSDGTTHSDGTPYAQSVVDLSMATFAPLGATVVTLRHGGPGYVAGIRFSYQHAMYETGRILGQLSGDTWQVEIFPAIRAPVPADARLEAEFPTVLCHLATDSEMDIDMGVSRMPAPSVNFIEAVDYWNDLALGVA